MQWTTSIKGRSVDYQRLLVETFWNAHAGLRIAQVSNTDQDYAKRANGRDVVQMTYQRRLQASGSTYTLKREKFQERMYCIEHDNGRCPGCDYMLVPRDFAYITLHTVCFPLGRHAEG